MTAPRSPAPVEVLVCVTCRTHTADEHTTPRHGAQLAAALDRAALPAGVTVKPVECLSNCSRGCTVALRGGPRWTYLFGNLDAELHLDAIIDGVTRYRAAADGLVPWRERPEHFRKNCIARIPPLEATHVDV